jgi:predicted helicase
MKHFEDKYNVGICFTRTTNSNLFKNISITNYPTDGVILGNRTYLAPLYYYNGNGNGNGNGKNGGNDLNIDKPRRTNFTEKFKERYLEQLDFEPTPEEIFAYIYAVLHSPIYREKYIEFLKTDFPSVPMTEDEKVFKQFAELGKQLIDLHLLEDLPDDNEISVDGTIEKCYIVKIVPPTSMESELKLITSNKNNVIVFENIGTDIYDFEVGSYKPIEKWLKYRIKDKIELDIDDIDYLKNILISIKHTIKTMQEIEKLGEIYL